ncbi:MAG TPA: DUF2993 domain-containing protein [Actinocrinis sp.]|nr:DUF2993 domain-containing protein [Actinocrinis sp.]
MTAPDPYSYSDRHHHSEGDVEPTLVMRRKRHPVRWILIVLIVLAGLLVAADRVALHFAQDELATKIAQQQKLSQKPTVKIDGFPFLTQAVSRNFGHATIDIHGLDAQGVPISDLHADLTGVHVSSGYDSATVDTLTATAELDFADLSKAVTQKVGLAQVVLSDGGNNQVKAGISVAGLIGGSVQVHVSLLPNNQIELKSDSFQVPVVGSKNFDYTLSLAGLPFGVNLTTLTVTSDGIDIVAVGHGVSLSQTSAQTGGTQ